MEIVPVAATIARWPRGQARLRGHRGRGLRRLLDWMQRGYGLQLVQADVIVLTLGVWLC